MTFGKIYRRDKEIQGKNFIIFRILSFLLKIKIKIQKLEIKTKYKRKKEKTTLIKKKSCRKHNFKRR